MTMANNPNTGLFDFQTPDDVGQQAVQAGQAQDMNFAQLAPAQQTSYNLSQAGRGIATAAGQAAGLQLPGQAKADKLAQVQTMVQNLHPDTPIAYLQQLQKTLQENGMMDESLKVQDKISAQMTAQAALLKAQREAHNTAADPINKIITSKGYTPESVAKYQQSGANGATPDASLLESIDRKDQFGPATPAWMIPNSHAVQGTPQGDELFQKDEHGVYHQMNTAAHVSTSSSAVNSADKNMAPEVQMANEFRTQTAADIKQAEMARAAHAEIETALKSRDPVAMQTAMTHAFQALHPNSEMNNSEIKKYANMGDLGERVTGGINQWLTGMPLEIQARRIQKDMASVRERAAANIKAQATIYHQRYAELGGSSKGADVITSAATPADGVAPVRQTVRTEAEAAALAPGTEFVGPDGVPRTR